MSERMSVPRCKECEFHKPNYLKDYSERAEHWCHWKGNKVLDNGIAVAEFIGIVGIGKFIKSSEYQTSPKWCPKRLKKESEAKCQNSN